MASASVVKCMSAPQYGIQRTLIAGFSTSFIHGIKLGSMHAESTRSHRVLMTAMLPPKAKAVEKVKTQFDLRETYVPVTHSMLPQKMEIFKSLEEWAENNILVHLKPLIEEDLPNYHTILNTLDGVRDETGASPAACAEWTHAWTTEENRHGDLLNKYLYLNGRVDMR
eukprot:Gb_41362 [translate_table: standard]